MKNKQELEESLDRFMNFINGQAKCSDRQLLSIYEAARLYTQGRTQSLPDTRSCTCHPDDAVTPCARKFASSECQSAAPPVTAPIEKVDGWLPIESAPRDGTLFIGYSPNMGVRRNVSFNKNRQDFDIGFSSMIRDWTHWMPQSELPAPPTAHLQLQRQGD